ncbi:MAG: efflux RND transporter periplasmic adaptor subunit [Lachnospiraceae bacterium]|nr:efflux RND transporter periplasmic adaptor subunit [Lachnospiraceae bacterium]
MMKMTRKKKRILLVLAALCVAICGAVYTLTTRDDTEEEKYIYKETPVEHGVLMQGIQESGSVTLTYKSQKCEVEINADDDSKKSSSDDDDEDKTLKVEKIFVTQGQRIKKGDQLMKLTSQSVHSIRRNIRADKADAELSVTNLENELATLRVTAKGQYDTDVQDGTYAQAQYDIDVNQVTLEISALQDSVAVLADEIKSIERELEDGWEDYQDLKEDFEKYERRYYNWDPENLYDYIPLRENYISYRDKYTKETRSRADKRKEIERKQQELAKKQADIDRLIGQTDRKLLDAKQTFDAANLAGSMASDVYAYSIKSLEEKIKKARETLEEKEEILTDFDNFVGDDGIVYAEADGMILEVLLLEGDTVKENTPLINYTDDESFSLSVDVSEEDIAGVKVGDSVSVVFTAYPDETFHGNVKAIKTTEPSSDMATVSFPVTISIEGDTSKLYGGMSGNVTFITDKSEEVDYVSRKAIVKGDDKKTYVYIKNENGDMELIPVETGFTDGVNVQIVSGLSKGDTVYIASKVSESEASLKDGETPNDAPDVNLGDMKEFGNEEINFSKNFAP